MKREDRSSGSGMRPDFRSEDRLGPLSSHPPLCHNLIRPHTCCARKHAEHQAQPAHIKANTPSTQQLGSATTPPPQQQQQQQAPPTRKACRSFPTDSPRWPITGASRRPRRRPRKVSSRPSQAAVPAFRFNSWLCLALYTSDCPPFSAVTATFFVGNTFCMHICTGSSLHVVFVVRDSC